MRHGADQFGDDSAEICLAFLARKHVRALAIQHRGMNMHAVAGIFDERFRHEGGLKTVLARAAEHDPAQHDDIVGGAQRIAAVLEIDLELARRRFLDDGVDRQALRDRARATGIGELTAKNQLTNLDLNTCRHSLLPPGGSMVSG